MAYACGREGFAAPAASRFSPGGEAASGGGQVLRLRAREGAFRAPARVTFFCCQKKVTKENHLNLRFKDPLARYGSCRFGGMYSRTKRGRDCCRIKGLCLRSPARRLPRPLALVTVDVFPPTAAGEKLPSPWGEGGAQRRMRGPSSRPQAVAFPLRAPQCSHWGVHS